MYIFETLNQVRELTAGVDRIEYLIFYRVIDDAIQIVRICIPRKILKMSFRTKR